MWVWADVFAPSPELRDIARRRPEVDWLCFMAPEERRWLTERRHLAALVCMFPDVTEDEWATILR
jgi:hypothetical protein